MSRIRTLFSVIVPSMLAGGLLFGSALGHASAGRDDVIGFWPAANDVTSPGTAAQGTPARPPTPPNPPHTPVPPPPVHPTAPTPPTPVSPRGPVPPAPPTPPNGVSVSINGNKVQIEGIREMVTHQLDMVRDNLRTNSSIPKDVRDKVLKRLDKVRATVDTRLGHLKSTDTDQLGPEMERMGEEIDQAMEGLDQDLAKMGDKLGKDIARQVGKGVNINLHLGDHDDDDDGDTADIPMAPDVAIDADDGDLKDAISELKDLALKPAQRDAIGKLRTDSDKTVATAKKQLDDLSNKLHTALANPATSDADIARYVDQISAQEAAIRKARILAWVNARRVLDDAQRKKVEDAAKKKTK